MLSNEQMVDVIRSACCDLGCDVRLKAIPGVVYGRATVAVTRALAGKPRFVRLGECYESADKEHVCVFLDVSLADDQGKLSHTSKNACAAVIFDGSDKTPRSIVNRIVDAIDDLTNFVAQNRLESAHVP